ncbi:hypothetical protein F8M41_002273 [Gigaspora margarita]|uniref:Uncharacterized protein n=1 Tax=Gigaspora margarita TaxID=4874 RepID=A0A8H3XD19_GIGMA|nr:hypothetical protein F8M41_002273 [Gigaspora margarita]
MHGKDGLPGNSGYNGGQFYAKGRNFINLSSLTIDISGGDGGKGQDGGNGADGLDGQEGGNGGRGFFFGDVGSYGSVWIEIFFLEEPSTIEERPTIIFFYNIKGMDGERGSPFFFGKDGPKFQGIGY